MIPLCKQEKESLKKLEQALIAKGKVPVDDLNLLEKTGIYYIDGTPPVNVPANTDCTWCQLIVVNNIPKLQIILKPSGQYIAIREKVGNPAKWSRWCKFTGKLENA